MRFVTALSLSLAYAISSLVSCNANLHTLRKHGNRVLAEDSLICGTSECSSRSTCVNGQCVCKDGWTGPACDNIDECRTLTPPPCNFDGAVCVDLDGSPSGMYKCACKTKEGWINGKDTDAHGPLSCVDVDECSEVPSPCHANATCINEKPGYKCVCNVGFVSDGEGKCVAPAKIPDVKPPGAKCEDSDCLIVPNTFCDKSTGKCTCVNDNFFSPSGLGGACQEVDFCELKKDTCSANATCTPESAAGGFFSCKCKRGFISNSNFTEGTVCLPHNECSDVPSRCQSNEICKNLEPPDTFKCQLKPPTNITTSFNGVEGVSNGAFTVASFEGVEIGLRGRLQFKAVGKAENDFNFDGENSYYFPATNTSKGIPVWGFDFSVNVDSDGTTGLKLSNFTYLLILDYDPAVAFDPNGNSLRVEDDPITSPSSGIFSDYFIGPKGVKASSLEDYKHLIATNSLIQTSWRFDNFASADLPFVATTSGTYTIIMTVLKDGNSVAETSINIVTVGSE